MTVAPYPLQWPAGRPRRPASAWKLAKFSIKESVQRTYGSSIETRSLTVAQAISRLEQSLERIRAQLPVVSTNLETRLNGLPRSGQREPDDPGVAVYFQLAGKPHCLPCDTYTTVADNIAAIAAHIEATRLQERHGVASVAEMFSGFTALPAPSRWWEVLCIHQTASEREIESAYRRLAATRHPDRGGSDGAMAELNVARDLALKEVRANA